MSKRICNRDDAKTALSSLVERAAAGEEIIIAKARTPRAKLGPVRTTRGRRKPGGWVGRVRIGKDCDAPWPAPVRRAFGGES